MKNNLFRQAILLVAAVLLSTSFWSCSKDEEPVPEPTPPVVSVTGVTLNKTSTSIQVGGTETLTATVSHKDAANKKVTWKSSNAAIASVDANGKVTGVKAGEATITVTTEDGGKTATCKVTVSDKEIKVTGVKLNKSETSLLVGGNETLTATVLPEDATNQNVTWKSDKPEIATVDANGKVTAVKVGEATITVTTEDGGKTATCKRYLQGNRQRNLRSGYGRNAQQDRNEYFCGRQRDPDGHRSPRRCHQSESNVGIRQAGNCLRGCQR